jgi:hypothetical protein
LFFFLFFFSSVEVGSISKPSSITFPTVLLSNFSCVPFCFLLSFWIFLHFLLFSASLSLYIYFPLSSWVFWSSSSLIGFVDLACIIAELSHYCLSYYHKLKMRT